MMSIHEFPPFPAVHHDFEVSTGISWSTNVADGVTHDKLSTCSLQTASELLKDYEDAFDKDRKIRRRLFQDTSILYGLCWRQREAMMACNIGTQMGPQTPGA